jgi:hypothetical protein
VELASQVLGILALPLFPLLIKKNCPHLSLCVQRSGSAQSLNALFLFVYDVILRECAESLNPLFLFVYGVILRERAESLNPFSFLFTMSFCENAQNPSMPFTYLPLPWSSLRGALCSPAAIQKLIKLLPWSWSWSWSLVVPSPLAGEGRVRGRRFCIAVVVFHFCRGRCRGFCRGSVVIARGALSPRGNPETDKAFAVAVPYSSLRA